MDSRSWGIRICGESGQTTVEYAVVTATTAIVIAVFLSVMPGDLFDSLWSMITDLLP